MQDETHSGNPWYVRIATLGTFFGLLIVLAVGLAPNLNTRVVGIGEAFWQNYARDLRTDQEPPTCDLEDIRARLAQCPTEDAATAPPSAEGDDPFAGEDPFAEPSDGTAEAEEDPFAGEDPFAEPSDGAAEADDPFAGDDPFAEAKERAPKVNCAALRKFMKAKNMLCAHISALCTKEWLEEEKAGKFLYRGVFGTQKPGGIAANAFDIRLKNIANTNVVTLGNDLLALWEASNPYALNPNNLKTIGISTLNNVLSIGEAFSAHPRFDPGHHSSPRMVTFGIKTGPKSTIRLMEFASQGDQALSLIHISEPTRPY